MLIIYFGFLLELLKGNEWYGFEKVNCFVDSREGFVVIPKTLIPTKPWIWRTEFFGHEPQADIDLLNKGYHVAYVDVQNMYGAPVSIDIMNKFYAQVITKFNLSTKVTIEGFSRGGLFAFNWAIQNVEKISSIYGDNPVLDFKSWPAGRGKGQYSSGDWQRLLQVYNMTEEEALVYKYNPIDNLAVLANAKIPILCICGSDDNIVPFSENSGILEQRYKSLGGNIKIIIKPQCNHHPHSLKNPEPIINFVIGCTNNTSLVNYTRENMEHCSFEWIIFCVIFGVILVAVVIILIGITLYFRH